MSQPEIGSAAFGAVAVHLATAELLRRGFRVAIPVVDDEGIDLVVNYRVKVQVKSSSQRSLETVPGYSYLAFMWSGIGANRSADVFLLHALAESGDRWFVVPRPAVVHVKASLTFYGNGRSEFKSGRRTIAGIVGAYEDRWDLFADLSTQADLASGEEFA